MNWEMDALDLSSLPKGLSFGTINLFRGARNQTLGLPVIAFKGQDNGLILGITATIHGNELNGISVVHHLKNLIDPVNLKGTIIMIPIINILGFDIGSRTFLGTDLNRIMPGISNGTPAEMFAYRFFHRVVLNFDVLLDLHTASFGRINSHYIRADLSNPIIKGMVDKLNAEIAVHTTLPKGSLRNAAIARGIPTVTIELGDPQQFQETVVDRGVQGILNLIQHLGMLPKETFNVQTPTFCKKSYWLRSEIGGILKTFPQLTEFVEKGSIVAEIYDLHGNLLQAVTAPEAGIVVGKSINPVTMTGGRIIHLGVVGEVEEKESFEFDIPEEYLGDILDDDDSFFVSADTSSDM